MVDPLLQTKLYRPPIRTEWVPRPRLIERLSAGLDRTLTLLTAPAGFGKTTLVTTWLESVERPSTWLARTGEVEHAEPPERKAGPVQPIRSWWLMTWL